MIVSNSVARKLVDVNADELTRQVYAYYVKSHYTDLHPYNQTAPDISIYDLERFLRDTALPFLYLSPLSKVINHE